MPLAPLHAGHWDWKGEQSKVRAWQEERSDQGDCQDDVFFSSQILNFEFLTPGYFEMMLSVCCCCVCLFRLTESSIHQWCILTTMGLSHAHSVKTKILSMFLSSCRLPFIENSYWQRLECVCEVGITRSLFMVLYSGSTISTQKFYVGDSLWSPECDSLGSTSMRWVGNPFLTNAPYMVDPLPSMR